MFSNINHTSYQLNYMEHFFIFKDEMDLISNFHKNGIVNHFHCNRSNAM